MRHGRAAIALAMAVLAAVVVVAAGLAFLWPSESRIVELGPLDQFAPGTVTTYNLREGVPVLSPDGSVLTNRAFHVVRLADGELRVLSSKDPHLGCAVPWRPDYEWDGGTGFFRDPCHLETFDMAGDRVYGPAPRGLDRFAVTVENGRVVVDLGDLTLGPRSLVPPSSGAPASMATPQATAPATSPAATPEFLSAADVPPYGGPTREVTGLFTEPRETEADSYSSVGPIPLSLFPEWDGSSVVLYDLEAGRIALDLGEGSIATSAFSPDGTKFAWVSGSLRLTSREPDTATNEVWVLDLETMEQRSYGGGSQASFHDDTTLRITPGLGAVPTSEFVDVTSGNSVSIEEPEFDRTRMIMQYAYGYRIESLVSGSDFNHVRHLVVPDDGSPALEFEAWLVFSLGANDLLVVAAVADGAANLFLVDIEQGEATFIATMFSSSDLPPRFGWGPSDAGEVPAFFAWSDYDCDPLLGRTRIYDLRSGTLTELDRALPVAMGAGEELALGSLFHRLTTLDIETLEYGRVMPGDIGPVWSSDERWAANGQSFIALAAATRCKEAER